MRGLPHGTSRARREVLDVVMRGVDAVDGGLGRMAAHLLRTTR